MLFLLLILLLAHYMYQIQSVANSVILFSLSLTSAISLVNANIVVPPSSTKVSTIKNVDISFNQASDTSEVFLFGNKILEQVNKKNESWTNQIKISEQTKKQTAVTPKRVAPTVVIASPAPVGSWGDRINHWCSIHACNSSQLYRVMICESGGNPTAKNKSSDASGLFQFMPNTFSSNAKRINLAGANIWNGEHQVQVAAYMFSIGQAKQWVCK